MLRAIIFDFDGVIADAEPLHLKGFQKVLEEEGVTLSEKDYYDKYLAMDDKTCFSTVLKDRGKEVSKELIEDLIHRKSKYYDKLLSKNLVIFPGVVDFIKETSKRYPLAVASGALRHEIEFVLKKIGVRENFLLIVSAEDVERCKPDPEVFIKALEGININKISSGDIIYPPQCLVIEDSLHGVKAAKAAGMKCLAIANSYPIDKLSSADLITESLEGYSIENLEKVFNDDLW